MSDAQRRPTLLYDGACGFCVRAVELAVERLPDRVSWLSYQTADLGAYGVSEAEAARAVQFVHPSGRVDQGAAAVARVLVASGGGWGLLGRLLLAPPLSFVAELVYRVVAALRGRL